MKSKRKESTEKTEPPDGRWGWMVVLGVSLVNLSTRPIEPSFGLLFGDLLTDLKVGTTGAGIIVSTYEALINFSGLLVGPLIKSFSYRKVAFFGSLLTGLGLIATSYAFSMAHILCTYSIISGLGIGFSSSSTFVSLNHYFKKRRGQAVGLTMAGTGLGLLLMPQAVRYLTEEYNFAGSMLILGAFSFNACVGSALLQPIKWHLRKVKDAEEQKGLITEKVSLKTRRNRKITTIAAAITEDEEEKSIETENLQTPPVKASTTATTEPLSKSSTEPRFDKYIQEKLKARIRKISEISGSTASNINFTENTTNYTTKKRRSSTLSNISHLDFHGSCHFHAIKQEVKELTNFEKPQIASVWRKFAAFMDFDLLKDPIFLNILFGLSIFYVAELNFKMVVPFFLAALGHSKSETAFCLSMMAASDIVARLILPPICDRIKFINRRAMFALATIFCAFSRSALAEIGGWIQLETILIISGFFRGATLINFMLVLSEYCENRMDKLPAAFGLHMVAKGLFIVMLGPVIGLIRDFTDSYPLCIHAQTILILTCSLAWGIEYLIVKYK